MSAATALLDRLGRPGGIRLGTSHAGTIARLQSGIPALDAALEGGLPRGRLTELVGPRSAGRTGLACRIAAQATGAGETIAWIDPADALDPAGVAAAGVALGRMLWVRPRDPGDALRAADLLLRTGGFGLVVLDMAASPGRTDLPAWSRLARAAEQTRVVLLTMMPARATGTFAALGLEMTAQAHWSRGPGRLVLLDGMDVRVAVARNRIGRPGRTLVVRQVAA